MKEDVTSVAVIVKPEEFQLTEKTALEITSGLTTVIAERSVLEQQYQSCVTMPITKENIPVFKALRTQIKNNRTKGIEPWHKTEKEFYLRGGQFVDAIKKKHVEISKRMEDNLESMEKFFENQEKERIEKLVSERQAKLNEFEADTQGLQLAEMSDETFEKILKIAKQDYEEKQAIIRKQEEEAAALAKVKALHEERKNTVLHLWNHLSVQEFGSLTDKEFKAVVKEAEGKKKVADNEAEKARKERDKLAAEADKLRKALEKTKAQEEAKKQEEAKLAQAPEKDQMVALLNSCILPKFNGQNEAWADVEAKFKGFKEWALKRINS